MMKRFLICGLMLIAFGAGTRGEDKPAKAPVHAGLEKLKKLAGTWVEADKDGKPTDKVVSVVKVTAAGSARAGDFLPRPADGDGVDLPPRQGRPGDDPLLRAGQPAADEGRPEVARQPDQVGVRRRHQPRPGEGHAHALGDRHLCR